MAGLVEQLQADALDQNVTVATLLRKVKVCAARLGLANALDWVQAELSGYSKGSSIELPEYRKNSGITYAQNEYRQWIPLAFEDSNWANLVRAVELREAVANYEEYLKTENSTFSLPLEPYQVNMLSELFGQRFFAVRNQVSRGHIHTIVGTVRDLALDWALELSRVGITGEGMSFTADERSRATGAHISIGTFNGTFSTGDASGAGASISQTYTSVTNEVPAIAELIAAVQAKVSDSAEREAIVKAAQDVASAPDKGAMLKAYERLLSAAANHMTVITPFLPALGQMLAG